MIRGVEATVVRPGEAARDRLGNMVPGEPSRTVVGDVLVATPSTEDMEAARAEGVTLALTLHFPRSFSESLRGCRVELPEPWARRGGYRVVGDPRPLMDANVPGRWHMPVNVEAADG